MQEVNQDETSEEAESKTLQSAMEEMIQVSCYCGHWAMKSKTAKYFQQAFVWLGHPYNPGFNLFWPTGHSDHDVWLTAGQDNCREKQLSPVTSWIDIYIL